MALTMPFKRNERFPALQQAVGVLEQRLPARRRANWWERPFGKTVVMAVVAGAAVAALAALLLRQRASDSTAVGDAATALGLSSTRTEAYDAHRAEEDGGVDTVQEAAKESFPASDPPVWSSGPDVPIIREGEHKDALPYQQR